MPGTGDPAANAADVVARLDQGVIEGEALQDLWRRHRRWVAAILLAHKPRWADLDDLLQEVALAVVRKVGDLRDPRAVRPWLRTVAINAAHAAGRSGLRRSRDTSIVDEPIGAAGDDGRENPGEEGRQLMALAARLPDGYREPLLLKAVQELSYREIGQILGLPETTIETRIARGRRMLRDLAMAAMPEREASALTPVSAVRSGGAGRERPGPAE